MAARPHIDEPVTGIVLVPEQADLGQLGPELDLLRSYGLLEHEGLHAGAEVWSGGRGHCGIMEE